MYPGYNSEKALYEERVHDLLMDARLRQEVEVTKAQWMRRLFNLFTRLLYRDVVIDNRGTQKNSDS